MCGRFALYSSFQAIKDYAVSEPVPEELRYPSVQGMYKLGKMRFKSNNTDNPVSLVPMYIRASQPERLEKEAR